MNDELLSMDFGPCCACGKERPKWAEDLPGSWPPNIIMLEQKAPTPGTGWGCVQCGLPLDGAVAGICDDCLNIGRPIRFAIDGFAKDKKRVPIESLTGEHKHDMSKHPEETGRHA
jgi:hypothetical protein